MSSNFNKDDYKLLKISSVESKILGASSVYLIVSFSRSVFSFYLSSMMGTTPSWLIYRGTSGLGLDFKKPILWLSLSKMV